MNHEINIALAESGHSYRNFIEIHDPKFFRATLDTASSEESKIEWLKWLKFQLQNEEFGSYHKSLGMDANELKLHLKSSIEYIDGYIKMLSSSLPRFGTEIAIQGNFILPLFDILKGYFDKTEHESLFKLLNGNPIEIPINFEDSANTFANSIAYLIEKGIIIGNKERIKKWMIKYFIFNGKACKASSINRYFQEKKIQPIVKALEDL